MRMLQRRHVGKTTAIHSGTHGYENTGKTKGVLAKRKNTGYAGETKDATAEHT